MMFNYTFIRKVEIGNALGLLANA